MNIEKNAGPATAAVPGTLVSLDGTLRFTAAEAPRARRLLERAGIDIRSIRTLDDYRRARVACAPYFLEWLESEIARKPLNDDRRRLLEVFGATPEA